MPGPRGLLSEAPDYLQLSHFLRQLEGIAEVASCTEIPIFSSFEMGEEAARTRDNHARSGATST